MAVTAFCEKILPPSFLVFLGFAVFLSLSPDAGAALPLLLTFAVSLIMLSSLCRFNVER